MKIRTKIMLFYTLLIVVSLGISMIIYTQMANTYARNELKDLTIKTIETQNRSLELLMNDVSDYTKELISDQNTQAILDDTFVQKIELQRLDREIAESVIFNHKISSAYMYDLEGNQYSRDKKRYKELELDDFQQQSWYETVESLKGGYYININAGGLIDDPVTDYISMFRMVNSNNDHRPIGFLMVNIEVDTIKDALNVTDEASFMVGFERDGYHEMLKFGSVDMSMFGSYIESEIDEISYFGDNLIDGRNYRIAGLTNDDYGWTLIHMGKAVERTEMFKNFNVVFLSILVIIGITIFYGSIYISRYISAPIVKLTKTMKAVQAEQFDEIELGDRQDEIGSLGRGYNYMIHRIQELIDEIISEQELIKKAELRILMEQIKPHFIYDTLDSISSLVSRGHNDEAYNSLSALGKFYRASLSDGNFIIDLETEIEIIKNYLYIQMIRYRDLFEVEYNIDPELNKMRVPKLMMQPLIENSIYHGIRPIGMDGYIVVTAKQTEAWVELSVEDNGIGMDEKTRKKMFVEASDNEEVKKSSVGLPATIRRIRNMYGENSSVIIESNNHGTKVTIKIPKESINEQQIL